MLYFRYIREGETVPDPDLQVQVRLNYRGITMLYFHYIREGETVPDLDLQVQASEGEGRVLLTGYTRMLDNLETG